MLVPTLPTRNGTADLLKGVAVILMIQVHILEQFAVEELHETFIGTVSFFLGGPPAAPVFLAVMGWFAIRSSKSLVAHLRRGILLIVGGIFLNAGLNANLLWSIHRGMLNLDPLAFLFGADILPLAGLSIILLAFVPAVLKQAPVLVLFAVAVATAAPFLTGIGTDSPLRYITPFLWGDQWWSYFPLFPWFSYVLLGAAAERVQSTRFALETFTGRQRLIGAGIVSLVLVATHAFAIPQIVHLPSYYHHGVPLMIWISAFLLVWTLLTSVLHQRASASAPVRYLKWLGRNVTSAYVLQWLLIGNIATEIYRTQNLTASLLWCAGICMATSLLVITFLKLRARFSGPATS